MNRRCPLLGITLLLVTGATLTAADGFQPIFDGKSLKGWTVIPSAKRGHWSVQKGVLVGQTDGKGSDLMLDGELRDFELKLEYRLRTNGNSGIHIRGLLGVSKTHKVTGYHADFGHVGIGPKVLGAWDFHGYPRGDCLTTRGVEVTIEEDGKKVFRDIVKNALEPGHVNKRGWNRVHVIVKGHVMEFTINGRLCSRVIDQEKKKRIDKGLVGLQLHGGPPMTIEFRKILLKRSR